MRPGNITIHHDNTGVLHGTENHTLVLSCSVNSGEPKETIMWFNDSLLLGIGGPETYALNIFPQKYDHGRIYTCIVNSSALDIPLKKNVRLDILCKSILVIEFITCIMNHSSAIRTYIHHLESYKKNGINMLFFIYILNSRDVLYINILLVYK